MKKLLSIFCSLAILIATGVSASAAGNYNAEVITALEQSFSIGSNTYALPDSAISQAESYLSGHQIATQAAADNVVSAIGSSMALVEAAVPQTGTDLNNLPSAVKKQIATLMTNAAYNGQIFSLGASQVTIIETDGAPTSIDIPALKVTNNSTNNSDSSTTSTPSSSTQVSVSTGTDGKQTVSVTVQADSAASVSNGAASLQATVPSDAVTAASYAKGASIDITAPTSAIVSQLNSAAVQNVSLTITAPSGVAYNNVSNANVSLSIEAGVLEAAKQTKKDVTVGVVDSLTGKEVYSWTFKGSDLANSTAALTGVNLVLNTKTSTLDTAVTSALPGSAKGVVLTFGNNGQLPAPATVKVLISDQGFKPGETVYAYYFNSATGKMEQLDTTAYTVDANGYINLPIAHCSQYVVLPVQVPSVKPVALDTGARLSVKAGTTYQFKVTSSIKPTFVCGNGSVFRVKINGSKGNDYFFKVTAIGKAGQSAGFYVNGAKTPSTIITIA